MRAIVLLMLFSIGCGTHRSNRGPLPIDTTSELPDCAGPEYPCSDYHPVSEEAD